MSAIHKTILFIIFLCLLLDAFSAYASVSDTPEDLISIKESIKNSVKLNKDHVSKTLYRHAIPTLKELAARKYFKLLKKETEVNFAQYRKENEDKGETTYLEDLCRYGNSEIQEIVFSLPYRVLPIFSQGQKELLKYHQSVKLSNHTYLEKFVSFLETLESVPLKNLKIRCSGLETTDTKAEQRHYQNLLRNPVFHNIKTLTLSKYSWNSINFLNSPFLRQIEHLHLHLIVKDIKIIESASFSFSPLKNLPSLTTLNLDYSVFPEASLPDLIEALKELKYLELLSLKRVFLNKLSRIPGRSPYSYMSPLTQEKKEQIKENLPHIQIFPLEEPED